MQLNEKQITNILALLQRGTFPVNGSESKILTQLQEELEKGLAEVKNNNENTING